ncbi:MAG: hypothetical protein QOH83_171 [Solirubrobacteraceae bacterium]|jgi:hypothetical protein|nr:hypothetical protein [Solirubrobacteraceae bacterium]
MIATLVDWDLLGQAVLSSFVIGLGVLVVAGVAVAASLRAQDARSDGNETAFIGFSAVTVLGVVAVAAAIGGGIWVMAQ